MKQDPEFTKLTGKLIANVRELAEWGVETGTLDQNALQEEIVRRTPAIRKEAARKLIESGMSQRQAAKVLGVDEGTVRADVGKKLTRNNSAKSAEKIRTHNAPEEDEPESDVEDIEPQNYSAAFLLRADQAHTFAEDCQKLLDGIDAKKRSELASAARATAEAWTQLARKIGNGHG